MNGTPDAATLAWAVKAIESDASHGETPIVVVVSDGAGYPLGDITAKARKRGTKVIGVNIDSSYADESYARNYGEGNYVPWKGSILGMARPIGTLIGKIVR